MLLSARWLINVASVNDWDYADKVEFSEGDPVSVYFQLTDLSRDNAELIGLAERILAEAFALGQLRSGDLKRVQLAGRALVYGFARMNIDGHFPRFGISADEAGPTAEAILDLFIDGIAKR